MTTTSFAVSPYTLPAALAAADDVIGRKAIWTGDAFSVEQALWLESWRERASYAQALDICTNATPNIKDHARWLQEKGWEAQITDAVTDDAVYLAAVLDITGLWESPGTASTVDGIRRVLLESGAMASSGPNPTVKVSTQRDGIGFLFRQVDKAPTSNAGLLEIAEDMRRARARQKASLNFPMVDLNHKHGADHMIGLRSGSNRIVQAAEQYRLELNETGGRASAAAELGMARSIEDPIPVTITGPFVVAVVGEALEEPIFVAYCGRDSWKEPGAGRI